MAQVKSSQLTMFLGWIILPLAGPVVKTLGQSNPCQINYEIFASLSALKNALKQFKIIWITKRLELLYYFKLDVTINSVIELIKGITITRRFIN